MAQGLLIVLSGPSGVGKGTIYNEVCKKVPTLRKSISVTTRSPREGEVEGVHYYFKTLTEYQQMIALGEFLETAEVYNNYYGTPKRPIFKMLEKGEDVIFELDTLGAKQIKHAYPEAVLIMITPPSLTELENRLRARGTESQDSLRTRINSALRELKEYKNYDYIVFNDSIDYAVDEVINIINSTRCIMSRNKAKMEKIIGGKRL